MDWYFAAPVWEDDNDCPTTTKLAIPCVPKDVTNKRVIHVVDAFFRGSYVSGHFLLSDDVTLPMPRSGIEQVEIYCRWFGHRLKTRGFRFQVDMSTATINASYSGPVFSDFTKRASKRPRA